MQFLDKIDRHSSFTNDEDEKRLAMPIAVIEKANVSNLQNLELGFSRSLPKASVVHSIPFHYFRAENLAD